MAGKEAKKTVNGGANAATTGLVWFRNGLRLEDNACVWRALNENETVYCLYCIDDNYMRGADIGAARAAFLLASLAELSERVQAQGGQFIVRIVGKGAGGSNFEQGRTGDDAVPQEVVKVAKQVGAGRIYANEDYLPYPMRRDRRTQELAASEGIAFLTCRDALLHDPAQALTNEGKPYTVFSPFKRRWESLLDTPERWPVESLLHRLKVPRQVETAPLPTLADYKLSLHQQIEPGGAKRAYASLNAFLGDRLRNYAQNRDNVFNPDSTSRLSMHIKWGTVSIRDCYREARRQGGVGADKWIDELAWREFFYAIIYHFPHALDGPMLPEYSGFPWSDNSEHLEAWKAGMTGYPFVDAGMRQMNATGFMHNRLRQVTASYLCKDLLINWQEGERYFMQQLTCGDWPPNNGGWQWVAGTGTDPRRATRIFNPTLQMERYDPKAEYVRQWVPEYGTARYPRPIVPHEAGRETFMKAFGSTASGREAIRQARKEEQDKALRGTVRGDSESSAYSRRHGLPVGKSAGRTGGKPKPAPRDGEDGTSLFGDDDQGYTGD